ncbi:hypothetical protein SAMN04515656_104128 [Eubacterium aggregans]|uniref:Uncharacterized protein n=1 Tax=Eubacterium aggregans TaxID=81409 RepID=A0A1H3YW41_9FIRM|nr:hypothetical protein SAMN04515656_104128 [Eubacterium aggregans]
MKTKDNQCNNDRCKKCKYSRTPGGAGTGIFTCDYILMKGVSRGCNVKGCTRFEKRAGQ